MAIARFKDLCLDAGDPARLGEFWAAVLGLDWDAKDEALTGPTPRHRIWINEVPEPHTVKNRVHLDIYARDLADLEALGARRADIEQAGAGRWTIMADPEGNEFCVFTAEAASADA